MFFKKHKKEAGAGATPQDGQVPAAASTATVPAEPARPIDRSAARPVVDPKSLGFRTTAELEPVSGLIGQDRALKAIQFGADIKESDFNIFVLGPASSGKSTAVKSYLQKKLAESPTPPDWVYVNNFRDANKPKALSLPKGRGHLLERGMIAAIDELRTSLPSMFEGEEYQSRRRAIDEEVRGGHEKAFEALTEKAQSQNIGIMRTPMGFAMAPMHEGKIVKPEIYNQLPEPVRREIEGKIGTLQKELEEILARMPKADKERGARLRELNEEFAAIAVREALDDLKSEFGDLAHVVAYLDAAEADLIRNVGLFLMASGEENELVRQPVDTARDARFRRYMVNLVVSNGGEGAPLIEELNPIYGNLIGRIEHIAQMGALLTDFLLIKPGALHRANGGYLLLDARKLLLSPFAWEALKRSLKSACIKIEMPAESMGLITTQSLEPEPIPLSVKIVLLGDRELYYMLSAYDPDFDRLFKVQADFDDTIARSSDNDMAYARLISSIVTEHRLKPVDAGGVARLIEEGSRLADDNQRMTIQIGRIADILREANFWAGEAGRGEITRNDIARAVHERIQRADRLRDRSQETIDRGIVLIDTSGTKVGQINGLSVLSLGEFAFGRPSRITARVRMGSGRVTDIEREVKLGGPLHSKGVMILWGFLAGRFAHDVPLALAASLVFEQSYGGVDGDSASAAELFTLLSALSEIGIKQSFAVTGSVNQHGEVQAIGGVNEKIEGYFDVCSAKGLTGEQGVLIPATNVQHLVLREDVVEAISEGKFAIYPVRTIDEGIEILTGVKAGERDSGGNFPEGTVNRRVEDRLIAFANRAKMFARSRGDDRNNDTLTS
ncbi:MAG: Lon protease family protein [Hyphomicrobiaceae bacterium]